MDKQPFEQIVVAHGATVLRVCRAVLGGHADAEDAWSETFLAALRAWPDLPADANVEAWLVTIAHRKALDAGRAKGRRAVPVGEIPDRHSADGVPHERPDDDLWDAVRALPDRQRRALAYHHLGGLPYEDVAGVLGGTPAAARKAGSDAVRSLRTTLERTRGAAR